MSKLKLKAKILACALCVMVATGCGTAPSSGNTVSSPAVSAASSTSQSEAGTEKAQQAVELPHSDKFVVADGAVVFTDKLGRDVSISQKPQRVIILDYNALDLWYHAGGTAVGRTGHILVDSRADEDEMGSEIKNVPGSKVSMLVDEEFYFHCDETKLNKIASWLYETDHHGYPILGNALIIGEKYGNAGIEFCEMSEEQFNIVFPKLEELGKRFKDAGN